MIRRAGRVLAVFGGVAALLVGVTYVDFGVESVRANVLNLFLAVVTTGALAAAWGAPRGQRLAALAVVVGVFAFAFGVHGGAVGCHAAEYPPIADHGVEYDWETNVLRFGDNLDGTDFRCRGSPDRGAVLVGYLLTSAGATELLARGP